MPWIKRGINRFIPSVVWQPEPQIPRTLELVGKDAIILDIGAGGRQITPHAIGVDFIVFPNTAAVSDIHHLAFPERSVDCVFCTGVLEHVADPAQALQEVFRVLKPGGIVHLEVPFMQPYHRDPEDYWRWTLDGLRLFARQHGFEEVRNGAHLGPTSAMNALIIAYWRSRFRNRYIRKGIDLVLSWLLFPFKYLDALLLNRMSDMASGVFIVGRKSDSKSGRQ